jgi:hypothetical protein
VKGRGMLCWGIVLDGKKLKTERIDHHTMWVQTMRNINGEKERNIYIKK